MVRERALRGELRGRIFPSLAKKNLRNALSRDMPFTHTKR
jgi:hypothetical protein